MTSKRKLSNLVACDASGKHVFGWSPSVHAKKRDAAFCLACGEPNPRCAECGRNVVVRPDGSTRCAKGHTHRIAQ